MFIRCTKDPFCKAGQYITRDKQCHILHYNMTQDAGQVLTSNEIEQVYSKSELDIMYNDTGNKK